MNNFDTIIENIKTKLLLLKTENKINELSSF